MKKSFLTLLIFFLSFSAFQGYSQDKVYKDGTVWEVTFIKTNYGMGDSYLTDLKSSWRELNEEAKKQGLIVSYKILSGVAANPEDWDMMLLVEYKNLAAMEGSEDKWNAIYKAKIGDADAEKKMRESRSTQRTIFGSKLMREVLYQ